MFGGGRFRGPRFENNNNSPERVFFHLEEPRARRPLRWIHNSMLEFYPLIHQGRWIQINEHQYVQLYHRISEEQALQEAFLNKPNLGNTLFEQSFNLFTRNAADIEVVKQYVDEMGRLTAQNHVYNEPNNHFIGLLGDSITVDRVFKSEIIATVNRTMIVVTLAVIPE